MAKTIAVAKKRVRRELGGHGLHPEGKKRDVQREARRTIVPKTTISVAIDHNSGPTDADHMTCVRQSFVKGRAKIR